jgi:hypothetical protein
MAVPTPPRGHADTARAGPLQPLDLGGAVRLSWRLLGARGASVIQSSLREQVVMHVLSPWSSMRSGPGMLVAGLLGLWAVACSGAGTAGSPDLVLLGPDGGPGRGDLSTTPPPDGAVGGDAAEGAVDVPISDGPPPDLPPLPVPDGGADGGRCGVAGPTELNPGWIGGACAQVSDCPFDSSVCLADGDGFPRGTCTEACDRLCPDMTGANDTVTFCIDGQGALAGGGMCVSKCDYSKSSTGCRPGYACATLPRFNEPSTTADVCVPADQAPAMPPPMGCYAQAQEVCLNYMPAQNPMEMPAGASGTCDVEDPLRLQSPVNGIHFMDDGGGEPSLLMRCQLALAIYRLTVLLKTLDVVEVTQLGTYNCRPIAGTSTLSQHGLGLAIDLAEFKTSDGTTYNVLNDFEGDISYDATGCSFSYTPSTAKGKWLLDLAEQMCEQQIFNIILTPNYNAAHNNHFHCDLTEGAHFLG